MSPIDKITDPSFTNSAKGLMTLFCIGLGHTIIGVELTEAKIAIPWFPTINFLNPQNLVYLYWGLVWYSMYRYCLEHAPLYRKHWFNSLVAGLQIGQKGERFVRKTIYLDSISYRVEIDTGNNNIHLKNYVEEDDYSTELAYIFTFIFSNDYKFKGINSSENPSYSVDGAIINHDIEQSKWGLQAYSPDRGHSFEYQTSRIHSWRYRYQLRWLQLNYYTRELLTNKTTFDLTLPLILNFMLFIFWVTKGG